jgi:cell division protein FtsL
MHKVSYKKSKWFRIFIIISVLFFIISLLFLRVWIMSNAVEIACETNTLFQKKESLEEENKKMMVELATLKSPERISNIAVRELNMVRSSNGKIVFLER